jgi:uncharacterized protein (TIGR03435 family)
MTTGSLAQTLSQSAGRPVFDRTGLTGYFVVNLEFAPEPGAGTPFGGPRTPLGTDSTAATAPDAPSLFAAVQAQLGLKLEGRREPMEVLVIDRAELPTPD